MRERESQRARMGQIVPDFRMHSMGCVLHCTTNCPYWCLCVFVFYSAAWKHHIATSVRADWCGVLKFDRVYNIICIYTHRQQHSGGSVYLLCVSLLLTSHKFFFLHNRVFLLCCCCCFLYAFPPHTFHVSNENIKRRIPTNNNISNNSSSKHGGKKPKPATERRKWNKKSHETIFFNIGRVH